MLGRRVSQVKEMAFAKFRKKVSVGHLFMKLDINFMRQKNIKQEERRVKIR